MSLNCFQFTREVFQVHTGANGNMYVNIHGGKGEEGRVDQLTFHSCIYLQPGDQAVTHVSFQHMEELSLSWYKT